MEYTLGRVGIVARGEYDSANTYTALDLVSYQGGSYMAVRTTSQTPSETGEDWMLIARKGIDGTNIGDMRISIYDDDNDGIVEHADIADVAAQAQALTADATIDVSKLRDNSSDNLFGGEMEQTPKTINRLFYYKSDRITNANSVVKSGAYGVRNTDTNMPYPGWWYMLVFCKNEEMGIAVQWAFQVRPEGNGEFWMRTIRTSENYYGAWVRMATQAMLDESEQTHTHPTYETRLDTIEGQLDGVETLLAAI